jgi:hypothetical protein
VALTNRPEREPRLWPALLRPALRRPVITLVLALAGLLLLAQPALSMKLHTTGAGDLPRAIPAMQSYDRLTAAFPSKFTTHLIAVQAPSQRAVQVTAALTDVVHNTEADPLFVPQAQGQTADIRASADVRDGLRPAADLGDHDGDVPVDRDRVDRNRGEPAVCLRGLRDSGDRVPAQVGRKAARWGCRRRRSAETGNRTVVRVRRCYGTV